MKKIKTSYESMISNLIPDKSSKCLYFKDSQNYLLCTGVMTEIYSHIFDQNFLSYFLEDEHIYIMNVFDLSSYSSYKTSELFDILVTINIKFLESLESIEDIMSLDNKTLITLCNFFNLINTHKTYYFFLYRTKVFEYSVKNTEYSLFDDNLYIELIKNIKEFILLLKEFKICSCSLISYPLFIQNNLFKDNSSVDRRANPGGLHYLNKFYCESLLYLLHKYEDCSCDDFFNSLDLIFQIKAVEISNEVRNFCIDWCTTDTYFEASKYKTDSLLQNFICRNSPLERIKKNKYFDIKLLDYILCFISYENTESYKKWKKCDL